MTKEIHLIISNESRRGSGKTADDPIRRLVQLWTKDGELIAEYDSFKISDSFFTPPEDLADRS